MLGFIDLVSRMVWFTVLFLVFEELGTERHAIGGQAYYAFPTKGEKQGVCLTVLYKRRFIIPGFRGWIFQGAMLRDSGLCIS